MKNIFYFCSGFIVALSLAYSLSNPSPVYAASPETNRDIFYTAIWNNCLTLTVEYNPDLPQKQLIKRCKDNLNVALNNNFFEYRHSDMFMPIPKDVYPRRK